MKKINSAFLVSILFFAVVFCITFYSNVEYIEILAKLNNVSEYTALVNIFDGNEYYMVLWFSLVAFILSLVSYIIYLTIGFLNFIFKK